MKTERIEWDSPEYRQRLLSALTSHIGAHNAIGMTALYSAVYDRPWSDRVNGTRLIRRLVTAMRMDGVPICSVTSAPGGYYLPAAGSEAADYMRRYEAKALRILRTLAKMKKTSLPNYLGQLRLDMEGKSDEAA